MSEDTKALKRWVAASAALNARERAMRATVIDVLDLRDALAAARAEIDRLNTWDGLLSILDEHYPAEVFEKSPDPGARIVTLTRHLAAAREENGRLREALEKYGRHQKHCAAYEEAWPCDCGWETMRAALAREDGGNG